MSKIGLILGCNIYNVPFFRFYERFLCSKGFDFDLICWNRSLVQEDANCKIINYNIKDTITNRNPLKLLKYYGFANFVKYTIDQMRYDKLIFLGTYACTVALLCNYLKLHYSGRYWVDIRDYTFESFLPYKKALEIAMKNAFACDISSRGFLSFLPATNNVYITHNVDTSTIERYSMEPDVYSKTIRISFIGNVRYFDTNVTFLNALKNDSRFCLQYYGSGSAKIKKYCDDNGIHNVDFIGQFGSEKTACLYKKTDIINNLYANNSIGEKTALSNKLYYAVFLNKPILVLPMTYIAEIVNEYDLGYVVNLDDMHLSDRIDQWYITRSCNNMKRQRFIDTIKSDCQEYESALTEFLLR